MKTCKETWKPQTYKRYIEQFGVDPDTVREACDMYLNGFELTPEMKRLVIQWNNEAQEK